MKFFKHHHLALIPLLSILAMSPSVMETEFSGGRLIASIKEEVKSHPKYESIASKVKPEEVKEQEVSPEKYKEKISDLKLKLSKEKENLKKEQIEKVIVELLLVEGSLKELEDKKLLAEPEITDGKKIILESKDIIEGLLTDLDKEDKKEETPVVADAPKEEPKKEEPKVEVCEAEEKNKVLTAQVQELMKQQNQILEAMIGMTNMMVTMFQQQQQNQPNPYYQNGPGFMSSPYQYQQPQTAGNWVYYPSGFQPSQQNIFAAPQMQQPMQQPMQQQMQQPIPQPFGGMYPDQVHQSNWSLQPTNYFGDARFQPQPQQPSYGTFGGSGNGSDPFSFNMASPIPTMAQR